MPKPEICKDMVHETVDNRCRHMLKLEKNDKNYFKKQ